MLKVREFLRMKREAGYPRCGKFSICKSTIIACKEGNVSITGRDKIQTG
ncbi:hypothetical protein SPACI_021830 [Sporomusa acidovorans DSM 3132]|uniref:Uncharacterized protein n=1 Tax=Sporomusa acidovorans (strain ATCC 49682 / DSM 3132 / Mol) TaxID=1123286 RepID=A0ABZ3J1B6_SPOA4|nr:hypothetical protein SPACI_56510 [Sporomusa acidovorans DSM 3132]SDE85697.1 hypothetical protein SAMN04488499_10241 [Sporomusa acidovorans]